VEELDIAFASAAAQHADAILPLGDESTVNHVTQVTALVAPRTDYNVLGPSTNEPEQKKYDTAVA
jgi:hypothetical protein